MITSYSVGAQKLLAEIRDLSKLALPASAATVRSTASAAAASVTRGYRSGGDAARDPSSRFLGAIEG